tara:strand:- start:626 stop:1933 length:1308 start_codon:yes stop_codon:yes gene_type:complete
MPRVLGQIFTFDEMKSRWDSDNPENPYVRSSTVPDWYDLDKWIIRVDDDDKTVSTTAWRVTPDYVLLGGTQKIPNSGKGHFSDLKNKRNQLLSKDRPWIAAYTNAPRWLNTVTSEGVQIYNEKYGGIDEDILRSLPEDIIDKMKSSYPEGNWGVYPATVNVEKAFEKSWWRTLPDNRLEKSWRDILKVDEVVFEPEEVSTGWFSPSSGKVTLNLAGNADKLESEIIEDVIETIIHEYSHKAVSSELTPLLDKHLTNAFDALNTYLEDSPSNIINNKESIRTNLLRSIKEPLVKIGKIDAYDETYAYITSVFSSKEMNLRIIESTENSMTRILNNLMKYAMSILDEGEVDKEIRDGVEKDLENLKSEVLKEVENYAINLTVYAQDFYGKMEESGPSYSNIRGYTGGEYSRHRAKEVAARRKKSLEELKAKQLGRLK